MMNEKLLQDLFDETMKQVIGDLNNKNPHNVKMSTLDMSKPAELTAKMQKTLYDAFIKVGFSTEQAFQLTLNTISPKR